MDNNDTMIQATQWFQDEFGKKLLAIKSLNGDCIPVGSLVLIFDGKQTETFPNESSITGQVLYLALPDTGVLIDLFENGIYKLYGVGLILQTPESGFQNHTVIVQSKARKFY